MGLRARANDSDKSMTVRAKCVEELLTTEVDYGKLLRNVIEVMFKGIYFRSVELFAQRINSSVAIFAKSSFIDVSQSSKHVSAF